ncbi:protein FAM227B-like isoform X3 [Xenia sp. Carnegie-2017]|uniref:protein FAM227B-like isoform X3 n=1 Tax=Xenia sp. Carnegie-2017 TaxID=2897299 RepID=UPI001F048EE4|nr:protein FAM227B-like isoform X3 [Xenia sp. Carnegie-2017]
MYSFVNSNGLGDEFDERRRSLSSSKGKMDSIDCINQTIRDLGTELTSFYPKNELVIESYGEIRSNVSSKSEKNFSYGHLEIDYRAPKQVSRKSAISTREKKSRDVNKFAGVYSMRTVMGKNTNPFHTHGGTINPTKKLFSKIQRDETKVSKRPLLVELHTFPGFNKTKLTPLPVSLSMEHILNIVTNAQSDLVKKPGFRKEFKKLFLSRPSMALVQDLFWWLFLEKYQSCPEIQSQIFNRVASNYVELIINGLSNHHYRDTFLKRYPSLVSQAVYTIFCRAFPTSYRQFDDRFKQDLADIVHQWIVGTRPTKRCWERWPLTLLEPEGMNIEEEIHKNVPNEFKLSSFEAESELRLTEGRTQSFKRFAKEIKTVNSEDPFLRKKTSLRKVQDEDDVITEVLLKKPSVKISCVKQDSRRSFSGNDKDPSKTNLTISNSLQSTKTSRSSLSGYNGRNESCHAGRGPDFQKVVFDVYGQSPLVRHFLEKKNLARDSGTSILVQRTEIKNLPPVDGPTYRDIINDSLRSSQETEKQIQSLLDEMSNKRMKFIRRQKHERDEFQKKENQVLSRHKDVKKISDLIVLRLSKTQNKEDEQKIAASIDKALKLDSEL